jgi:hypothetical protein
MKVTGTIDAAVSGESGVFITLGSLYFAVKGHRDRKTVSKLTFGT